MRKYPRNPIALCGAATLLGAAGITAFCLNQGHPQAAATPAELTKTATATAPPQAATAAALAAHGLLWEPGAAPDQRTRTAIPVLAEPLHAAVGQAIGNRVRLKLSDRFPALAGEVTASAAQDDGTVVTHLRIDGDPQGTLTLQENQQAGFFLGQLVYDNHPVAYEFRRSGGGLMATRHALSDLLCAMLNPNLDGIEAMGLPPVDKAKADKANHRDKQAIAQNKLIQEAKPGGTTPLGLSVADGSVIEGDSGVTNLVFTVTLSKADRSKTITVNYATQNGTAVAGSDYTAVTGTVSFAPRSTSRTVSVPILGDTAEETAENFLLLLDTPVNAVITDGSAIGTLLDNDTPAVTSTVPILNSLPGAAAVAYLDMDGQVITGTSWLSGGTIDARGISTTYTEAQMIEIWQRVAEDYAPFQLNVTTDEAVFLAAAPKSRIRCIITPDNEWYGGYGGVAYLNSFTWTGDTPCWVFSDQLANTSRYIAEAAAHEIGHTLSLRHDGRTSPAEGYYTGHGSGEVGWAPIMGVGYYQLLTQWSRGEYLNADNNEDDLGLITSHNGFSYRTDQQPATPAGAPALAVNGTIVSGSGIIETRDDADTFAFTTTGGAVNLSVLGAATSQDLDVLAEILDAAGSVIATANPDALTDASVAATLPAGTYYLRVCGVGRGAALADGYPDYASLGQYSISGTVP